MNFIDSFRVLLSTLFRDESKESLFNLTKIYEQIDFNEDLKNSINITKGNFMWRDGIQDTQVLFIPNKNGRFLITWVPPVNMQNAVITKGGIKYPLNEMKVGQSFFLPLEEGDNLKRMANRLSQARQTYQKKYEGVRFTQRLWEQDDPDNLGNNITLGIRVWRVQ